VKKGDQVMLRSTVRFVQWDQIPAVRYGVVVHMIRPGEADWMVTVRMEDTGHHMRGPVADFVEVKWPAVGDQVIVVRPRTTAGLADAPLTATWFGLIGRCAEWDDHTWMRTPYGWAFHEPQPVMLSVSVGEGQRRHVVSSHDVVTVAGWSP
jgi:hypothetical protein